MLMRLTIYIATAIIVILGLGISHTLLSKKWRAVTWSSKYPKGIDATVYQDENCRRMFGSFYTKLRQINDEATREFAYSLRDDAIKRFHTSAQYWESGYSGYSEIPLNPKFSNWEVTIQTEDNQMIECSYAADGHFIQRLNWER